ncbi:MAG: alpha/beta hydrolase fold domain-containing protein [Rhodobacteraceae bacterium]|jgi:dienelactone hydrolase|nr:alpha/beta hydrolase fold domain-containing protein [Paracoccaceae bacterium]
MFALVMGLGLAYSASRLAGVEVLLDPPERRADLLRPAYRVTLPPDAAPGARLPVALLISGCDGPRDNLGRWAAALSDIGWASMVVDSHGPRGLNNFDLWRAVCAAAILPGPERAGDIAVALAELHRSDWADPSRVVLIGASHGGWAVHDFLALASEGRAPFGLTDWPAALRPDPRRGIVGVVTLYPYCGIAGVAARAGWTGGPPVLMLLAQDDAITDEDACLDLAAQERAVGVQVETHVYPGVTHGFDTRERSVLSGLRFDAAATDDALRRITAFLQGLPAAPG